MNKKKHDCHKCIWSKKILGSINLSCCITKIIDPENPYGLACKIAKGEVNLVHKDTNEPMITICEQAKSLQAKSLGWANWPIDFNPVWVEDCQYFVDKNIFMP